MTEKRSRGWCFTINNYTDEDLELLNSKELNEQKQYIVYEKEKGESETPHIQGFIYFFNPKGLKSVSKFMPRAHLEIMKGTTEQASAYCKKDNNEVFENGAKPQPGKRNDFIVMRAMVNEGYSINQIIEEATSYQSVKSAELLLKYRKPNLTYIKKNVHWYWGKSGTGKTRTAVEEAGDDFWISGRNLKWWQGYTDQKKVIFDDFRADFCTFHELLRILDGYPYSIELKGSSTWLTATEIWITSPFSPECIYSKNSEEVKQLLRRITNIKEF